MSTYVTRVPAVTFFLQVNVATGKREGLFLIF